jgi:ribonuclease P protein component
MERLKQRADFLAAAAGAKVPAAAFILQARNRQERDLQARDQKTGQATDLDRAPPRFGFTVSKKVGNAVERNRVRRRLREVVRLSAALPLQAGHDYVLIGRRAALDAPFARMMADFAGALRRLHKRR